MARTTPRRRRDRVVDPRETTTESSSEPTDDANASSDYCDALKGAKDNLSAIDFTQINEDVYAQLTSELVKVAAVAPSDLKDDWASCWVC